MPIGAKIAEFWDFAGAGGGAMDRWEQGPTFFGKTTEGRELSLKPGSQEYQLWPGSWELPSARSEEFSL